MTTIPVRLVGKDSIFKEGLKSLLVKNDFSLAGDHSDPAGAPREKAADNAAQLVINIVDEAEGLLSNIGWLKGIYPQAHIVIIGNDAVATITTSVFEAGADALISKDISCEGLIGSLKLAAAGEKVYPASLFSMQAAQEGGSQNDNGAQHYNLSKQELRIVHGLANGEPNKVIAHHLNISEATVKVHVRTVLRKLGARNRTKAAILAISQGLAQSPPARSQALAS